MELRKTITIYRERCVGQPCPNDGPHVEADQQWQEKAHHHRDPRRAAWGKPGGARFATLRPALGATHSPPLQCRGLQASHTTLGDDSQHAAGGGWCWDHTTVYRLQGERGDTFPATGFYLASRGGGQAESPEESTKILGLWMEQG